MDALIARLNASLNEQQILLETAINARTTATNGNAQVVVETVNADGTEQGNAIVAQGTENNGLRLEVSQMDGRLKILLPVLILVIFKVLADNLIIGAVTIVTISGFYRIKTAFELEIALKERSNKATLGGLCILSTGLFLTVLFKIDLFGYQGHFADRLLLKNPDATYHASILQTIWICAITDGIMQLFLLTLKMYAVCVIGLASQVRVAGFKSLFCVPTAFGREGLFGSGSRFGSSRQGAADLESGGGSFSHPYSSNQPAAGVGAGAVSALIGSISGLVHRHVNSLQHSAAAAYSSVRTTTAGAEPAIPTATMVDGGGGDGLNSSDGSATGRESKDFLLKVRVCSLIDVVGLSYRSALPIVLWAEYFAACAIIGPVLQVLYVALKLFDLISKAKGATQAVYLLASNTLEFGHYSTSEELQSEESGSCDCPVCFDNPHTPVTLDCQHIFCEVCILEWLEKEQTCPVCRAQVVCCHPHLQAIKTDAASTAPIVV